MASQTHRNAFGRVNFLAQTSQWFRRACIYSHRQECHCGVESKRWRNWYLPKHHDTDLIVWRQLLDYPKLARPVDGCIYLASLVLSLAIAVLSGINTTILTTFDAQTGHQLEQSFELSGSPLDVEILSPDWPGDSSRDIVTLSSGGHLRRFHHQELVWESSASKYRNIGTFTNSQCERKCSIHSHFVIQNLCRVYCCPCEIVWRCSCYFRLSYREYSRDSCP